MQFETEAAVCRSFGTFYVSADPNNVMKGDF